MKQQTKTKIANAIAYTIVVLLLVTVMTFVGVLIALSWKTALVLAGVAAACALLRWVVKHTDYTVG